MDDGTVNGAHNKNHLALKQQKVVDESAVVGVD